MSKNFRQAFKHIFMTICTNKLDENKRNINSNNNPNKYRTKENKNFAKNENEMKVFPNGHNGNDINDENSERNISKNLDEV